jgi:hypothetical protein
LPRHVPQPLGDGVVFRSARQLLATGHCKLNSAVAVGAASARHQGAGAGVPGLIGRWSSHSVATTAEDRLKQSRRSWAVVSFGFAKLRWVRGMTGEDDRNQISRYI